MTIELAERIHRGRQAIAMARKRNRDTSDWERHLANIVSEAGNQRDNGLQPWVLWEWRRSSVPDWRRTLEESIRHGDRATEDHARWMLKEILLDPDYLEMEG